MGVIRTDHLPKVLPFILQHSNFLESLVKNFYPTPKVDTNVSNLSVFFSGLPS